MIDRDGLDGSRDAVAIGGERVGLARGEIGRLLVLCIEISAAEMVFAADVVDLGHELLIGLHGGGTQVRDLAVGAVRQRNMLQEVLGRRAQQIGGNAIVRERSVRRRIVNDGRDIGKVSDTLLGRRDKRDAGRRGGPNGRALVGPEKEQLVFNDSAVGRSAEIDSVSGCRASGRSSSAR